MNMFRVSLLATGVGLTLAATGAGAQELRFMCYADGNECEVSQDIITRFEAANPDIKVIVDTVPYQAILETLPVQLAAGEGPDLARVTDLGGLSQYYLDISPYVDAAYWEENFGKTLSWYRKSADDTGIYGMMTQLSVTGPYINKTLFDQAGVQVPADDADWDSWAAAARQVAEATQTPFPMALDRSGHRIAGPAISMGARIFSDDGTPALVDDGFRAMIEKFVAWNQDGTMAIDVWGGQGGATYQDAAQEFVNGQLVYYFSGSWQVARFDETIGDAFDWHVVGSPCGEGGCTGMPGGAGMVGFAQTEHPEAVAKVMDWFAAEDNHAELIARTKNVPAHAGLAAQGLDYPDVSEQAAAALAVWARQVPKISPVAYAYQGYAGNRAMFNATVNRVTQAIVGELSVDDALERISADIEEAEAEAAK
ncbi:MAG: carbohydrate ABC transporter substrate-binding protein [Rhizobiales bacterium]|nr:carbohydrate ABC transporter substrate-binding protein [Hyphomicrobiales bacterium]